MAVTAYRRKSGIEEAPYDGELILFDAQNQHAVSLNASAAALWEALAWPHTARELADLLQEATATLSRAECANQAETLINDLLTHDLIEALSERLPVTPVTT